MAKNSSLEDLYITLGLDVSELTSDFIEVDKTISQNLAKINREKNFVKLNAQIDINNLDPVKDAQEILKIKSNELTDIIEGQRQKVKLLETAWLDLANSHGYSSDITRKAEERHLKETVALQNLEKELEQVKKSEGKQDEPNVDTGRVGKFAEAFKNAGGGLQGAISGIKSAMGDFNSATASTEGAVSKFGAALSKLKHPAVIAGATLTALPVVAHTVSKELIDMARPAIEAGDAVYKLSRRMDESVGSAAQFSTVCKAMGTDADYLLEQIEDLSKDFLTGGSEKTDVLEAFGVDFTNADGTLKTYHERMLELANGMDRAAASGQKLEFQQMLTEESLGDMITAIEDYGETSKKISEHLVKSDLADPKLAHDLQGEITLMDMQADELHNAFSQALMPVAADLIPQVTETFGNLVRIIKENKEEIQYFGDIASTVLTSVGKLANIAAEALGVAAKGLKDVLQDKQSAEIDLVVKDDSIKTFEDFKKYQEKMGTDFFSQNPAAMRTEAMEKTAEGFARAEWKKVLKARAEEEEAAKAAQKAEEEETTGKKPPVSLDTSKLKEYQAELESIKYKATHSDIENQIYDINKWAEAQKEAAHSETEKATITELAEAKIQEALRKSNEESKQRTEDYLSEAQSISSERTMSAYEKEIAQIDKWKEKAMEKAETVQDLGQKAEEVAAIEANAAAKAADAYEKEVERIKNATKSFQDEIYELTHSQYENDMKKLWEKYQKGLSEGVDKDTMDSWFRLKQAEVNEKARHDTKGEYTRGGQFQFTPNYDVPNYVEQARQAIGASSQLDLAVRNFDGALQTSSQQLGIYNDRLNKLSDPTQVYDVFGNIKEGWTEVRNGFGHILEYTPAYSDAMKNSVQRVNQFNSQLSQSKAQLGQFTSQAQAQAGLARGNAPQWQQVYDVFGREKVGWREANINGMKIMENVPAILGEAEAKKQGLSEDATRSLLDEINARQLAIENADPLGNLRQGQFLDPYQLVNNAMSAIQNQFQNPYQTEPQTLQNPYDDTVGTNLANASMQLSEAATNLAQATGYQYESDQFSQITEAINNMQGNKNPININVNIGNAVTPDSESMTWLADAVSDKIAPIVENAVGNSENSY